MAVSVNKILYFTVVYYLFVQKVGFSAILKNSLGKNS